jgi:hypothetical protein
MTPICVRFGPGFLSGAGFPERNLLQRGSITPKELLRFSEAALAWFSISLEHLKIREKNALREILLQRVSTKVK